MRVKSRFSLTNTGTSRFTVDFVSTGLFVAHCSNEERAKISGELHVCAVKFLFHDYGAPRIGRGRQPTNRTVSDAVRPRRRDLCQPLFQFPHRQAISDVLQPRHPPIAQPPLTSRSRLLHGVRTARVLSGQPAPTRHMVIDRGADRRHSSLLAWVGAWCG